MSDEHRASSEVTAGNPAETLPWFQVSVRKFVIMSFFTWGIYQAYWSYRQWQQIIAATGEDASAFWRAALSPIWNFALFRRIKEHARLSEVSAAWNADLMATAYIALTLVIQAPDPWWLGTQFSFLPMLPVVRTVELINSPTPDQRNDALSTKNWIAITIGSLVLVLMIVALAMKP